MKNQLSISCETNFNRWFKLKYFRYQNVVKYHHWKILLVGIGLLGLCWLGFKSMEFEKDLMNLWIYNSSRLHNETSYMSRISGSQEDTGSIETILHVSSDNILSKEYLLEHLQLLQIITNLSLRYEGRVFTLAHFCQKIHLPKMHLIDMDTRIVMENYMPCKIITPINCFWEGSTLCISNEEGVKIDWRSFNVYKDVLHTFKQSLPYSFFQALFKEAGIGAGYVSKPCIDVTDPFCPNKKQKNIEYETILNQGCYQIAENLYKYSKSIFLGKQNRGLQSLLLLRSSADVYQSLKTNDIEWNELKVQHVINLWLNELRKTVIKFNKQRPYLQSILYKHNRFQSQRIGKSSFYVFTNNSLNSALTRASNDDTLLAKYFVASGVVMLFVVTIFVSSDNLVRSHCWLAICSTMLLVAAIISGLGLTAAAGFTFSVLTTQVVPFLMIGLGLDEVVILTNKYSKAMKISLTKKNSTHPVAQILYECATMLLLSFSIKVLILCAATLIPIALMRSFCIQVLFITVSQTAVNVFLYPCLLYLDTLRRKNNRIDLLCCLLKRQTSSNDPESQSQFQKTSSQYDFAPRDNALIRSRVIFSTEFTTSPDSLIPNNVHQYCEINPIEMSPMNENVPSRASVRTSSRNSHTFEDKVSKKKKHRCCWKFRCQITRTFLHIIVLVPVQITVILVTILIIIMGLYSAITIDCGLIFDSIFIRDSNEYNYVKYESKNFRMQTFDILTKDFNYIDHQESVLKLNDDIKELVHVEMFENGKFWLSSLILWLQKIQNDFDQDVKNQLIFLNGTWMKNASKNGLLAMTLMVQDGETINYKKLITSRLVRSQKVDENNFYLLLNVWRSVSVEFDSLPCILFPKMSTVNMENVIPNSNNEEPQIIRMSSKNLFKQTPLQFVSCKYFFKGQSKIDELQFVKNVRAIVNKYTDQNMPTIPIGNIFSLFEQYIKLRFQLMIVSIILVVGMFVISVLAINHFFASILATLLLSSSLLSPMVLMNFYQIPLNATSGVMALWSGGLGFRFSLFLIVSYVEHSDLQHTPKTQTISTLTNSNEVSPSVKSILNRGNQLQLKHAFEDVQCGKAAFSTFLGMTFISLTDTDFLWQHFLLIPLVGFVHSLFNYYCLAPLICFYFIHKSKFNHQNFPADKTDSTRSKYSSRSSNKTSSSSVKTFRSHNPRTMSNIEKQDESSIHEKLSIIPEESSSILSSIKSNISRDNQNNINDSDSDSSQTQENFPKFMKQNVESSLFINYINESQRKSQRKSVKVNPELAVKTSFKYHQPFGQDS